VATPEAVAAADPSLAVVAAAATAQVAAACVVSAITCPFIVSCVFKKMRQRQAKLMEAKGNGELAK
jgi:2-keto-3-deoxygluconate permease